MEGLNEIFSRKLIWQNPCWAPSLQIQDTDENLMLNASFSAGGWWRCRNELQLTEAGDRWRLQRSALSPSRSLPHQQRFCFIRNADVAGRTAGRGFLCKAWQLRGIQYFKEMMSEVPAWRLEIGGESRSKCSCSHGNVFGLIICCDSGEDNGCSWSIRPDLRRGLGEKVAWPRLLFSTHCTCLQSSEEIGGCCIRKINFTDSSKDVLWLFWFYEYSCPGAPHHVSHTR